jgi:hypothetical protein
MKRFTADFETTTDENDCRVWAWATVEIGNESNFEYGNNIIDFIEFCKQKENYLLYFHNLKFDGEFIFNYLLTNGYKYIKDSKEKEDKTFTVLISDMGQFYSIEIYFEVGNKKINKVTIQDSLKILNFSVSVIAKTFNLEISKLEIDYHEYREIGHTLTKEEIDYIRNDVTIVAKALENIFAENLTKMTIGSDALYDYKQIVTNFNSYFPVLEYELDKDIRQSYKGGFTYLNPIYKEKDLEKGIVLDVNSLYPSVMYYEKLPFGNPMFYEGKYEQDKLYNLYIQMISCTFKIKKGKIPSIQIKGSLSFIPNEYLTNSGEDLVTLVLTNVDLKLFFEQYDVYDLTYHSGWKFKSLTGLFCKYIEKWSKRKIEAKKENNGGLYTLAKLMLNSLYGKFGLNPNIRGKYPYLSDDGIIKYRQTDKSIRQSIYIPVASFITSYARDKTIRTSQLIRDYSIEKYGIDYYVYSDTDSIHSLFENDNDIKDIIDIDDYKLGSWKWESSFKRARFIRQKCYIEEEDDLLHITSAGLPKSCYKNVTWENFRTGFTTKGKLTFKHVKGGVILEETEFTIKKDKFT